MAYRIEIPESIANGIRLPEPEIESRLRLELALALYAQEILSFGKASELAGLSRFAFAECTSQRGIPRHYKEEELAQDLAYARRQ